MDSLDQPSRYVGGEQPSPAVSRQRLDQYETKARKGRSRDRRRTGRARTPIRQAGPGHVFAPDTPWQAEMEDAFGFTETVDQFDRVSEVKSDMEKPVPIYRRGPW